MTVLWAPPVSTVIVPIPAPISMSVAQTQFAKRFRIRPLVNVRRGRASSIRLMSLVFQLRWTYQKSAASETVIVPLAFPAKNGSVGRAEIWPSKLSLISAVNQFFSFIAQV